MTPPRLTDERIAELIAFNDAVSHTDTLAALRELQRLRSERVKLVKGLRMIDECLTEGYKDAVADALHHARTVLSSIDDKENANG